MLTATEYLYYLP